MRDSAAEVEIVWTTDLRQANLLVTRHGSSSLQAHNTVLLIKKKSYQYYPLKFPAVNHSEGVLYTRHLSATDAWELRMGGYIKFCIEWETMNNRRKSRKSLHSTCNQSVIFRDSSYKAHVEITILEKHKITKQTRRTKPDKAIFMNCNLSVISPSLYLFYTHSAVLLRIQRTTTTHRDSSSLHRHIHIHQGTVQGFVDFQWPQCTV